MRFSIARFVLALTLLITLASLGPFSHAQTAKTTLLALSKHDHTLAIVDAKTLKVLARLPVGVDPHEVIASSDGTRAYVTIYGFNRYHTLNVLDLVAQKALPDMDTGALTGLHGVVFVGGKVWFTAEGAKDVARFNPSSNTIDWIMGTGQNRTHMLYVTPDEKTIYTTNVASGTVSILEQVALPPMGSPPGMPAPPPGQGQPAPPPNATPRVDWNQTIISVGRGDEGFDVSPDGRELWTANSQDGTLSVIDLSTKKVTATVDAKFIASNRLKFTPDGKLVFISSLREEDVLVYDAATRKEYRRIHVGDGAAGIQMDPDGSRAFIACTPNNYVAVVDLKKLEVTGHIDVGGEPDGLAWAVRP